MPDPILFLQAVAAAALTAAAVVLAASMPWRKAPSVRSTVAAVIAAACGFATGCWWLGVAPSWPPREDQDRFLFLVLPAAVVVEVVAALVRLRPGKARTLAAWGSRAIVASSAAPVLLYHTSYLTDLAGPGTREWSPAQTWAILAGLGVALLLLWTGLVWLARRGAPRSVALTLSVAAAGAGVTVMFSGYATGGQLGLPLAAALGGVAVASLALSPSPDLAGAVAFGTVGLFGVLSLGRFFGELSTTHAVVLFFAPLLAWVPELLALRRPRPVLRAIARVTLVLIPVGITLWLAQRDFVEKSNPTGPGSDEGSYEDYMNFGK